MVTHEVDPEAVAHQLGAGGVDNLVANAERICDYQQRHIELTNQGAILSFQEQYNQLVGEERRIETLLLSAPPSGDARRLRRRAIYCWVLTAMLTLSGLAFTLVTLAPFRLGWTSWLFAIGIAAPTPYLVEKLLDRNELLVRILNVVATAAAVAALMFLADVRGNLFEQQIRQDQDQTVVLDDSVPSPEPETNFYERSNRSLHFAMLLLAFSMEVGAGLALREAWRSVPDSSEDWTALRGEIAQIQSQKTAIIRTVVDLRNEPGIFASRFWRDFYRAMLSNAVRSAMTRFLVPILVIVLSASARANAEDRVDLVVAIDLTQSVAIAGPDGKTEFQKNVEGVSRVLARVPAGARVTVIGITDRSFSQPYILMSARMSPDPGYFGERLNCARNQLVRAWKLRCDHLDATFQHTDILGAIQLASQIFAQQKREDTKNLLIFSDMRQNSSELDLESSRSAPSYSSVSRKCGAMPVFRNTEIDVLGADGEGRSNAYWRSLEMFWKDYFSRSGAELKNYSVLRELPVSRRDLNSRP